MLKWNCVDTLPATDSTIDKLVLWVAGMCCLHSLIPSRLILALTFSLPGVIKNGITAFKPASLACLYMDAQRDKSSYNEFVHQPI